MVKTYKAIGTQVSLCMLVDGQVRRISFSPVSNYVAGQGGSEFTTANESLQKAIESQYEFGRIFYLKDSNGELVTELPEEDNAEDTIEVEDTREHIKVASINDAKLWLIDNKGWEPKGRLTKRAIQDVAASYNIVFEGLE